MIKPKGCDSLDVSTFKKLFIQEAEKEKEKDRKGESEREIAVETEKDWVPIHWELELNSDFAWVGRYQLLDPSSLPLRFYISRKVESGAGDGYGTQVVPNVGYQHLNWVLTVRLNACVGILVFNICFRHFSCNQAVGINGIYVWFYELPILLSLSHTHIIKCQESVGVIYVVCINICIMILTIQWDLGEAPHPCR